MQCMPPPKAKTSRASTGTTVAARVRRREDRRTASASRGSSKPQSDDDGVRDVVVDVGVVDELAVDLGGRRGEQRDDLEPLRRGRRRPARRTSDDLGADRRGRGDPGRAGSCTTTRAGAGERGDDVDVAAGAELAVVGGQAARQPDRGARAQLGVHLGLDLLAGPAGVAARVELDGVREQDRPVAVDVEAAALLGQARRAHRGPGAAPRPCAADPAVVLPRRPGLRAPAVEHPVDARAGRRRRARTSARSRAATRRRARPPAARSAGRAAPAPPARSRGHEDRHRFVRGDGVRDGRPRAAGAGQVGAAVLAERGVRRGERHPGALVRFPLGGHVAPGAPRVRPPIGRR